MPSLADDLDLRARDADERTIKVHGHQVSYRTAGEGPVVLLLHGMCGSSATWKAALPLLAEHCTVVAPDLPGHGHSDKPRGDYSLGAFASTMRDLLVLLGHERATVVGQSLGGGIAMQLAYQHPERCERLVLVGSGGLGPDVSTLLRALSLPGAELVIPVACQRALAGAANTVAGWAGRIGLRPTAEVVEMWRAYASLTSADGRAAFVQTLRSVIDHRGQRVSAHDRLHLADSIPTLIMWGDEDRIIPVGHAHEAHDAIPGSRLEVFEGAGHFLHCSHPERFAGVLGDFVATTEPAQLDVLDFRDRLLAGSAV